MQSEDYIGQPLSSLPDGSVAAIGYSEPSHGTSNVFIHGDKVFLAKYVDGQWSPMTFELPDDRLTRPIIAVLKLGKPRPRTLGEVEPWVAWSRPSDGYTAFRDDTNKVIVFTVKRPLLYAATLCPHDLTIGPDWTRLGPIEGIVIGGKVYGKEATDE